MSRFGVSKSQRAFTAVALLLAVLYMAAGLSVWLGVWNPNEFARSPWGVGGLLAGFLIVLGVWMQESSPLVAAFLVVAGELVRIPDPEPNRQTCRHVEHRRRVGERGHRGGSM